VPTDLRKRHNDVAGFIYAVVGIAYAVLLGLVLVAVWEQFETARNTVEREADELAELFWLGHRLPETEGHQLQELTRSYARVVVDEEWPLMARGESSPRAWALIDEIRLTVQNMNPDTEAEQVLYDQGLERVHDLADARRDRLVEAREGIPSILWVVLVVGAIVTVGFTYLFGIDSTTTHTLMVALLAFVIGLVLFTIGSLEYPFSGDARLGPDAFELVLKRFASSKLSVL
jgi:Ca2+/Na+ antiporter